MHWYVVLHGQENKKMIKIVVLNSSNNSICALRYFRNIFVVSGNSSAKIKKKSLHTVYIRTADD